MITPSISPTDYDAVPYPSGAFPQTHPDRLATIATLHGMSPANVEQCRVLELGCGDGTNLITMAYASPGSEFVGVDLSQSAVRRGQDIVGRLGLKNIRLHHLDLQQIPGDWEPFDYLLAHGLYSWVPIEVRDKLMALCGHYLSSQGIAYVSYNAYPGNHLRDIVRRISQFHVGQFDDPAEKVRQARSLIQFLADAKPTPGLWQQLLKQQLDRMTSYIDAGFYHDDLSPINHPVYFHEFIEHAARHGLQYLSEADPTDLLEDEFPEEVRARLQPLDGAAVLAREQYRDFLKGRSFRQTLLCRQDIRVERDLAPQRLFHLHVAGEIRPASTSIDPSQSGLEDFHGPKGAIIATGHSIAKAALLEIGRRWPDWIPFEELLALARKRLGSDAAAGAASHEEDANPLAAFLVRGHEIGFIELHSRPAPFCARLPERPKVSALARLVSDRGPIVPTLRHLTLKLEDNLALRLFRLLDGTHDLPSLTTELEKSIRIGETTLSRDGQPISDTAEALRLLGPQIQSCLRHFVNSGILEE